MSYKLVIWSNLLGYGTVKPPEELLVDLLYHLNEVDPSKIIPLIAQAAGRLHRILQTDGPETADQELITAYCPEPFRSSILQIKKQTQNFFFFSPLGFRLVHHLLLHKLNSPLPIKTYPKNIGARTFFRSNSLWIPISTAPERITDLSLSGIFLMANELLDKLYSPLRATDLFYLTRQYEFTGAIGRIRSLFENKYFDDEFVERFGFRISSFLDSLSSIFIHVLAKDPMVLSPSISYKCYPPGFQAAIQAAIPHLATDFGGHSTTLNDLQRSLRDDLVLDRQGRGKPLLHYQGLFYCMRPDLLTAAQVNLPIHMILTDAKKKREGRKPGDRLLTMMGPIFEALCFDKTKEVIGEDRCKRPEIIKPLGDLLILIKDDCRLMIEAKATIESDKLLRGDRVEILKKFILPELNSKSGPNPGPLQVMQRATEYRKQNNFNGELYTAVIYLNAPPALSEFDELYIKNIPNKDIYKTYHIDPRNRSTFLLSMSQWELILSAVQQGGSLREILNNLAGLPPSKVGFRIIEWMKTQNMQISSVPIYKSEIEILADKNRQGITVT